MVYPILLDARPAYMAPNGRPVSLLLAPAGAARLVSVLHARLAGIGAAPLVLTPFEPTADYEEDLRAACPDITAVLPVSGFRPQDLFEPSDWLLFVDSRWCSLDALLPTVLKDTARKRSQAIHVVTTARHAGGLSERVELAPTGAVQRIQRYYDGATWQFVSGVARSLVAASCLRPLQDRPAFASLSDLRTALALRGVPSRDVPIDGTVFDLSSEANLVRLNEEIILARNGDGRLSEPVVDPAARVHAEARLVGPVIVQEKASIEADAVVIGPTVIGAGAHVAANATVVQSVIAHGVTVFPSAVVRGRALYHRDSGHESVDQPPTGWRDLPAATLRVVHAERSRAVYPHVKSAIDRIVACAALLLLSPLLAIVALLIKLESRGRIFFADLREGLDGRPFRCIKFRTMMQGSDRAQRALLRENQVDGPQFKLEKDPRLTRLGRWLRPMSLDELPQLFNVLRGDMSLIGPRPSPFRENQMCVPWRDARLTVRPGITGLWQVCRYDRRAGDFHQWIYFDLLYVQHLSFWLDLKILLATIWTRGGKDHVPLRWMIGDRAHTT